MSAERLAYEDPDDAREMARNASACRSESHLTRAVTALSVARRTAEVVPGTLLEAPRVLTRTAARTAVSVTDQAARFAARLFD